MTRKQFLVRLDPQDPIEARLIHALEQARKEWGGVQRALKEALMRYYGVSLEGTTPVASVSEAPVPSLLLKSLRRVIPGLAPHAAEAMAASEPLRNIRALYAVLEDFSPDTLTEVEALLLQVAVGYIHGLLEQAAAQRQPIRQILERTKPQEGVAS